MTPLHYVITKVNKTKKKMSGKMVFWAKVWKWHPTCSSHHQVQKMKSNSRFTNVPQL